MSRIFRALTKCSSATALLAITASIASAQTFTTLYRFSRFYDGQRLTDGPLIQGLDGNLWGTTIFGGTSGSGTIFKITAGGTFTTVYSFCAQTGCPDGESPVAGLTLARDGNFYGTTGAGGAYNNGTVFKFAPSGNLTTLYSFCSQGGNNCLDGSSVNGLVQAANANFYGTTYVGGGTPCATYGCGTVFEITPSGAFKTLYRFCTQSGCPDGSWPGSVLTQASNGDLYGTTVSGGVNGDGTVFKITPSGTLTSISLCSSSGCPYGDVPLAGLIQAASGYLYSTTNSGGAHLEGAIFKTSLSGMLSLIYNFCSQPECADSAGGASLIQGSDGKLYGPSGYGGANGSGTIFSITLGGAFTTLYTFCPQYPACSDGMLPGPALVQATDGNFYGTTQLGGNCNDGCGTIFRLSTGLTPFVKSVPDSGRIGEVVRILGSDLTGATSVAFNRIPAVFAVVSATQVMTNVPAGATSGWIKVTTPRGTLSSAAPFLVQ